MKNYYKILGVESTAEQEIIDEVYNRLKAFGVLDDKIVEAYAVIGNVEERKIYDAKRYANEEEKARKKEEKARIKEERANELAIASENNEPTMTRTDDRKTEEAKKEDLPEVDFRYAGKVVAFLSMALGLVFILSMLLSSLPEDEKSTDIATPEEAIQPEVVTKQKVESKPKEEEVIEESEVEEEIFYVSPNNYSHKSGYIDIINTVGQESITIGYINNQGLNIRTGPKSSFSKIGMLDVDDVVVVFGEYEGWYDIGLVSDKDELYGWVYKGYLDVYEYNHVTEITSDFLANDTKEEKKADTHVDNETTSKSETKKQTSTIEETVEKASTSDSTVSDDVYDNTVSSDIYEDVPVNQETKKEPTILSYFTIGSTKEEVQVAMGSPDAVQEYPSIGDVWSYGNSRIDFTSAGYVEGYSNRSSNLKVSLGDAKTNHYFSIGSTKQEVVYAMGTPNEIEAYPSIGDVWSYGNSRIDFTSAGYVEGYSNRSSNLKVSLGDAKTNHYFSIGSTKQEVVYAMGTPNEIEAYPSIGDVWSYGNSRIDFTSAGYVESYNNQSGNLKIQ